MSPRLEFDAGRAAALYRCGWSFPRLAEEFGVCEKTVRRRFADMGVRLLGEVRRPGTVFGPGAANIGWRGGPRADHDAHHVVEWALDAGALVRPDGCEVCGVVPRPMRNGRSAIQAHHDDYSRPLDVRWLCRPCHRAWHDEHDGLLEPSGQLRLVA